MYQLTDTDSVLRLSDNTVIPPGHRWYDEYLAWLAAGNEPQPIPQPPAPTLDELRQSLLDAATAKRWEVMTGGLTLPNGVQVGTAIDDQNRITSVVANASLAGLADSDEVDFKSGSGWVRLTIAEVKAVAGFIGQFVQACYSAERAHHEAIALLETAEQIHGYDASEGWPETEPT